VLHLPAYASCRQRLQVISQLASLALAIASPPPAEPEGHAPSAAPAPAVVAQVHARAVRRRVGRVALLNRDGRSARHARRVVHPRRPHEVSRRHCKKKPVCHIQSSSTMSRRHTLAYLRELGQDLTGKRGHENEEDAGAGQSHSSTGPLE
jgi:hypothetical protein